MIHISFDRKKKSKSGIKEFSKKALTAMIIIWFIGAVFGVGVVFFQLLRGDALVSISDVLMYIGAPMTGGIVAYMIKSAQENKEKIKRSGTESEDIP